MEEDETPAGGEQPEVQEVQGGGEPGGEPGGEAQGDQGVDIIDRLFAKDTDVEWVKALDEDLPEGQKGWKVSQEKQDAILSDPHVRQLIHNFRTMAHRKAGEAAAQSQEVAMARRELEQQRLDLEQQRAAMFAIFSDDSLKASMTPKPLDGIDPLSPEGQAIQMENLVAKRLQAFFGQLSTVNEEARARAEEAMAEARRAEQREALKSHMAENADFWSAHREHVRRLTKRGMPWKEAVEFVQGLQPKTETPAEKMRRLRRASLDGRVVPQAGDGLTDEDVINFSRENPGSVDLEALSRRTGYARRR